MLFQGEMRNKRKLHGSFRGLSEVWGDSLKDSMLGVSGDRDAFMVNDLYSGLKHLYPTKTKNAEDTQVALQNFIGKRGGEDAVLGSFRRNQCGMQDTEDISVPQPAWYASEQCYY